MTSERIKEIQATTGYPDSVSIKQALLQVWNECEQSHTSPMSAEQVEDISKTIFASIDHYREAGRDDEFNIKSIAEYLQRHFATTPSVKAEGWVSVEDGLPEDGEDVLCISKSINCPVLSNYNNSAFEVKKYPCPSDRVLIAYWEDVTHWQPLPNPPKQQL